MQRAYLFLSAGWSGFVTSAANVNWEFLNAVSGTALHVLSFVSISIGIFLKWGDIVDKFKQYFK